MRLLLAIALLIPNLAFGQVDIITPGGGLPAGDLQPSDGACIVFHNAGGTSVGQICPADAGSAIVIKDGAGSEFMELHGGDGTLRAAWIEGYNSGDTLGVAGYATSGAGAVGVAIGNRNTLAAGKIVVFYSDNGSTEEAYVDFQGGFYSTAPSGQNAFGATVNGARIDFGAGASDYASSDGTNVTFASTLIAANLISNGLVATPTIWAPNSNADINVQARGTTRIVKIGNGSSLAASDTIAGFYSDAGTTLKLSVLGDGGLLSTVASGGNALMIPAGSRICFDGATCTRTLTAATDTLTFNGVISASGGLLGTGLRWSSTGAQIGIQGNDQDDASAVANKFANGTTLTNDQAKIAGFYNDNNGVTIQAAVTANGMFVWALGTPPARPACSSTYRGYVWMVKGGAGVTDSFAICSKDAADAYAWRALY